jgi:dsRNA-specific ribonuclease
MYHLSESILNITNEQTTSAVTAAKNLFSNSNSSIKTPISLLQEICMKCHIQPIYEVLSTEGQIHEPTFVYKVSVGDINAVGKGTSKKRAKHTAALSILNEIKLKSIGKNDQLAIQIESLM